MNEQPMLFEGEGGPLKPGDRVRDPQTGRVGTVHSLVPAKPRVYVQWESVDGWPGPFSARLESGLEKVTA